MGHGVNGDEDVETVAPKATVTSERFVSLHSLDAIPLPNVPWALEAVDADHPHGTPGHESNGYSVLQQHVLFFDLDNNGIIYPWETFQGFRAIGFNFLISFLGMVLINGTWIPGFLHSCFLSTSRTSTRTSIAVTPKCTTVRAGLCQRSLRSCSASLPKVTRRSYSLMSYWVSRMPT